MADMEKSQQNPTCVHSDMSIKKIKTLPLKHPMQRSEQMRNGMNYF